MTAGRFGLPGGLLVVLAAACLGCGTSSVGGDGLEGDAADTDLSSDLSNDDIADTDGLEETTPVDAFDPGQSDVEHLDLTGTNDLDANRDEGGIDSTEVPIRTYQDRSFSQAIPRRWTTDHGLPDAALASVAVDADGRPWVGCQSGLFRLIDSRFEGLGLTLGVSSPVTAIVADGSGIWVNNRLGLHFVTSATGAVESFTMAAPVATILGSAMAGGVWILAGQGPCRGKLAGGTAGVECSPAVLSTPAEPTGLAETFDGLFLTTATKLYRLDEAVWVEVLVTVPPGEETIDIRGITAAVNGDLLIAARGGLGRIASGGQVVAWLAGTDGLPFADIRGVSTDADGKILVPAANGLIMLDGKAFDLIHGGSWLPSDQVNQAAYAPDGTLWVATESGLAEIRYTNMTLEQKALFLGEQTYPRHNRLGYISDVALNVPGDLSTTFTHDNDNDGQWTAMWLAALSYQYAVTKDPEIRNRAIEASRALRLLQNVTYDKGFIARSIVPPEDCPSRQGGDARWQLSADGLWCWKSKTSTDEFIGHVYGQSIYYDLVADAAEKAEVASMIGRLMDHVVGGEYSYTLKEEDGYPTEDGHMDPGFMETVGQFGDAGLNAAMILSGLIAAHRMTGEVRFQEHLDKLISEFGYAEYVRREKEIQDVYWVNHDSDEMAFMAFHALLWNDDDLSRRDIWLDGLSRLWDTQRPERNPEFNFTWASHAPTDADIGLQDSIRTLKEIHLSLVVWWCHNGGRLDLTLNQQPDRFGNPQSTTVPPYHQRHVMKWNSNPYGLDSAADGRSEEASTFWILPYWMGRYEGFITAPLP
jgi:hypothetical protein